MKLALVDSLLLKLLFREPQMAGEITQLLARKGVQLTLTQAQTMGRRLQALGYIDLCESRAHVDAMLMNQGLEYLLSH